MDYYKAGMFVYALAFLLGVVFLQQFAILPELSSLITILLCSCLFFVFSRFVIKHKKLAFKKEVTLTSMRNNNYLIGLMSILSVKTCLLLVLYQISR